jgi:thiamine-monophosphate kinase
VKPEDRFVEKLRALLPPAPGIRLGPGDDAAVVEWPSGLLAATTDMLVEGVDFLPGEDAERLGRRAVAVNLSDLAAMGARPEFFLLSIAFPGSEREDFPLAVARGAIQRAAEFGAHLAGGDLSAAPAIMVSAAAWGRLSGEPLTRGGASPGDRVYVSGTPGDAAAGLRVARRLAAGADERAGRSPGLSSEHRQRLLDAYRDPVPRVALGLALARQRLASAAIDVSDGLGLDAGRLARASGARVVLENDRLPISPALVSFGVVEAIDPVELAVSGGDDYELLFTVPEAAAGRLGALAAEIGVPVTHIGAIEAGRGAVLRGPDGERDVAELGHDHLEAAS